MQNSLDQFYTKSEVAAKCWRHASAVVAKLLGDARPFFIEPSAGDGVFYELLPRARRVGLDVAPRHCEVARHDFLQDAYQPPVAAARAVVIGNPPFGKRGKLAVAFVNQAFAIADTVAFIVPVIFAKYFIHKQIAPRAKLIRRIPLPRDAFRTDAKNNYAVNTEFQIWTRRPSRHRCRRLRQPPPIAHPDFVMHQYNNTAAALKVFARRWNFAVPSQGWQDYSRRETRSEDCEKHKQWILFYTERPAVRNRLFAGIDYAKLAMQNTTAIPGFRKGDVVAEYMSIANG